MFAVGLCPRCQLLQMNIKRNASARRAKPDGEQRTLLGANQGAAGIVEGENFAAGVALGSEAAGTPLAEARAVTMAATCDLEACFCRADRKAGAHHSV